MRPCVMATTLSATEITSSLPILPRVYLSTQSTMSSLSVRMRVGTGRISTFSFMFAPPQSSAKVTPTSAATSAARTGIVTFE